MDFKCKCQRVAILLCVLVLSVIAHAQLTDRQQAGAQVEGAGRENLSPAEIAQRNYNARMQFAHGMIIRVSNGKIYNAVENQQWQFIGGTVYEKSDGLVIVQEPRANADTTYLAITNFQGEVLIDKEFDGLAIRAGTFNWHGDSPIAIYDMGTPYVPPPPTPAQIAAAKEAARLQAKYGHEKMLEAETNTVRWLLPQATNGDASAQCDLGEHYLNGQGCETNLEQAIFWLQKSAAQGNLEASNKLATLKP